MIQSTRPSDQPRDQVILHVGAWAYQTQGNAEYKIGSGKEGSMSCGICLGLLLSIMIMILAQSKSVAHLLKKQTISGSTANAILLRKDMHPFSDSLLNHHPKALGSRAGAQHPDSSDSADLKTN